MLMVRSSALKTKSTMLIVNAEELYVQQALAV